jgi:hypothetical protein
MIGNKVSYVMKLVSWLGGWLPMFGRNVMLSGIKQSSWTENTPKDIATYHIRPKTLGTRCENTKSRTAL